jgi:hypothetical protein
MTVTERQALLDVLRQDRSLAVDLAQNLSRLVPLLDDEDAQLVDLVIRVLRLKVVGGLSELVARVGEQE